MSHEAFCRSITEMIADGGFWGIPRSGLVFKFFKETQTMLLVAGDPDHPDVAATRVEFAKIGWTVS